MCLRDCYDTFEGRGEDNTTREEVRQEYGSNGGLGQAFAHRISVRTMKPPGGRYLRSIQKKGIKTNPIVVVGKPMSERIFP
jgi:hypothetical protein